MVVSFAPALTLALVSPAFFVFLLRVLSIECGCHGLDVTSFLLPLGWTDTAASHPERTSVCLS